MRIIGPQSLGNDDATPGAAAKLGVQPDLPTIIADPHDLTLGNAKSLGVLRVDHRFRPDFLLQ